MASKKKKIEDTTYKPPVLPEDVDALKEYALKVDVQLYEMTERRNNLTKYVRELCDELDALRYSTRAQREREAHDLKIRKDWDNTICNLKTALRKALSDLPLPSDTYVFESNDWEKLYQLEALMLRFSGELQQVKKARFIQFEEPGQALQVIESEMPV